MRFKGQRVAVYARYSTDKQNPRSIDDQVRACLALIKREGGRTTDVQIFQDAAVSGSVSARAGLDALKLAVKEQRVDAVVTEDLSRLGRNQIDTLSLLRTFKTLGARLVALDGFDSADGRNAKVMGTIKTLMGELYLDELKSRTARGMHALYEGGYHTGGRVYGYRSVSVGDGSSRMRLEINPEEARVVRRIFAQHIKGTSLRMIATSLNSDGVTSARGGKWTLATIQSMLRNELYAGTRVFNRRDWQRDHETGARRPTLKISTEVRRTPAPELRIVDAEAWQASAAKRRELDADRNSGKRRHGAYPLSGLLACAQCGELLTVVTGSSAIYYTCSGFKRGLGCQNRASVKERVVRERLLAEIADRIGAPKMIEKLRKHLSQTIGGEDRLVRAEISTRAATLGRVQAKCKKLLGMIVEGDDSPTVRTMLRDEESNAEMQRVAIAALEQRLGRVPVLPSAIEITGFLRELPRLLEGRPAEARTVLARLFKGRLLCSPPKRVGQPFELRGTLLPGEILDNAAASGVAFAALSSDSCGGRIRSLHNANFPEISIVLEVLNTEPTAKQA